MFHWFISRARTIQFYWHDCNQVRWGQNETKIRNTSEDNSILNKSPVSKKANRQFRWKARALPDAKQQVTNREKPTTFDFSSERYFWGTTGRGQEERREEKETSWVLLFSISATCRIFLHINYFLRTSIPHWRRFVVRNGRRKRGGRGS